MKLFDLLMKKILRLDRLQRRDGFSGGISHKSRFVDRSNIPRKIGRPQFNGADKRVQTSGGLKTSEKEKKSGISRSSTIDGTYKKAPPRFLS